MPKAISFFAGAGGLDMGIHKAGFDVKLAFELEKVFCKTLEVNHPEWNVIQGDILALEASDIYKLSGVPEGEEIDLFIGGSPCQSFSTAGKREAFDSPDGQAMLKYAELIEEVQPKAFLLENVKGLLSAALKHTPIKKRTKDADNLLPEEMPGSALAHLLSKISSYEVKYELLNSANYGVPQTRERVFLIGVRKDLEVEFNFPNQTHSKDAEIGKERWITAGEILFEMKNIKHTYQNYTKDRLSYMKLIPKGGGNWRDLRVFGEDFVKQAMGGAYLSGGGKVGFFRRIDVKKPSPTLLTSPSQKSTILGHPYEYRPLSIEEYKRIQGFPDNYNLQGTLTQQYKQIGNAVPVKMGEVLGNQILKTLNKIPVKS